MNSFNHYAYGSVVSWLYDTVAGLQPLPEAPGWKRFRIAPQPGGGLTHATGRVMTPHGLASSAWQVERNEVKLVVMIPPNTEAEVALPTVRPESVTCDGKPLTTGSVRRTTIAGAERTVVTLPSGRYEFRMPLAP